MPLTTLLPENKLPSHGKSITRKTFRMPMIMTSTTPREIEPLSLITHVSKTIDSQNRMLSFLDHRINDFQDTSAQELLGDWLSQGSLPQPSFHLLQLKGIPDPPSALLESPNYSLALEYYAAAHQSGKTSATIKLAMLVHEQPWLWYGESKDTLMGYAAQENELVAIKTLAMWKHEASLTSLPIIPDYDDRGEQLAPVTCKRKQIKDAFKLWIQAAQLNDIESSRSVSECYKNGAGVNANDERSFEWLKHAARLGDSKALANVASVYREKLVTSSIAVMISRAARVPEIESEESEDEMDDERDEEVDAIGRDALTRTAYDHTLNAAKTGDVASLLSLGDLHTSVDNIWTDIAITRCIHAGLAYYLQANDQGTTGALLLCVKVMYEAWQDAQTWEKKDGNANKIKRSTQETIVGFSDNFGISCENAGKIAKVIESIAEANGLILTKEEDVYEGVEHIVQLFIGIQESLSH